MNFNRLLIVEDDAMSCQALRSIFARQGWEVAVARTVAEGLAQLDPPPRWLILDLNLPDGSGEAILKAVRAARARTLVAVCSGTADPKTLAAVRALDPEALLAKPYDLGPVLHLGALARARTAEVA